MHLLMINSTSELVSTFKGRLKTSRFKSSLIIDFIININIRTFSQFLRL